MMLMLCVAIPRDLTSACAKMDSMEMAKIAQVIIKYTYLFIMKLTCKTTLHF